MLAANFASYRTARYALLALATVTAAISFTTDSAEARRHHRARHRSHHSEGGGYSPAFASIIVDANSGDTLQATAADGQRHPASLTKIMTLYMLFEQLENGKLRLDTQMDVSEHASEQAPTKLGLRPGQSLRVEDAIKGIVTRSANDAAVVVAETIGGSEEAFAKLMTRKARALGMSKTTYVNASGLPDEDQITTARDQATLGRAIQDRFPKYYRYFATEAFLWRGHSIRNHNHLLGQVEGVDGIKTGYTRSSGFNLVTSMRRGNRHLVGVVLGGRSGGARDAAMRSLLAEHLAEASTRRTVAAITERNPSVSIADADDSETPKAAARVAAQAPAPIQTASAVAEPIPAPAPRAMPAAKPTVLKEDVTSVREPAPLTSGVISSQLAAVPGSADPMTPVRVKTVQFRMAAGQKPGAAAQAKMTPPSPTTAVPVRVADASPTASVPASQTQPAFPAPLPVVINRSSSGLGQGSLGMPPTTLGAQAQALETPAVRQASLQSQPVPAPAVQRDPAFAAAAPGNTGNIRSGWIIQVGALESESEARHRLDAARGSAGRFLGRANSFTEVFSKGSKTYYRARFAGLDQDSAEGACRALKRSDISCMAIKN